MRKENIRKQKIIKKRSIRGKAEHALDFRDDKSLENYKIREKTEQLEKVIDGISAEGRWKVGRGSAEG